MIKSLNIRNFQSHEKTKLEFSDGVNVIVGSSDSGKSAIIRALRWACWNKPSGNSFCSTWGGETSVGIETEEGSIFRTKNKKDQYLITRSNDRKTLFEAFGTNVPEEVAALLNVDEINLQYQLDAPFLLSLSPGQVAGHFNRIAKLDQIDKSISYINKSIRALTSDKKYQEQNIETKEQQLFKYEYLEKFEVELEVLEVMETKMKQLRTSITALSKKIESINLITAEIKSFEGVLSLEEDVIDILSDIFDKNEFNKKIITLTNILDKVNLIKNKNKHYKKRLDLASQVDLLILLYNSKQTKEKEITAICKTIKNISNINDQINKKQDVIKRKQDVYNKTLKELGVCPTCGSKIK
jgi:DNA repair exonuclease SbcCD ATPase subunit